MATQRRFCGVCMTMSPQHGLKLKILLETVLIEQNFLFLAWLLAVDRRALKTVSKRFSQQTLLIGTTWSSMQSASTTKSFSGNCWNTRYTRRSPENRTQRKQTLLMHAFAAQALCFLSQQKTTVESFRGICPGNLPPTTKEPCNCKQPQVVGGGRCIKTNSICVSLFGFAAHSLKPTKLDFQALVCWLLASICLLRVGEIEKVYRLRSPSTWILSRISMAMR